MASNVIDEPAYRDRRFVFKDRLHAGELLAIKLKGHVNKINVQLLTIPAGGVPVGCMVARGLDVPLDVVVVRKVQIPWNSEAGFGAVAWDGTVILNEPLVRELGLTPELVQRCISKTQEVVEDRLKKFRGEKQPPDLRDKTVILVDDGLASGFTMLVAVKSVRNKGSERIIVAVPTASTSAVQLVAPSVDKLICLNIRGGLLFAVADAYQKWYDLSDEEVIRFLKREEKSEAMHT